MFGKINWKLWWASFFAGASVLPLLAGIAGAGAGMAIFFVLLLFIVLLIGWNLCTRDNNSRTPYV
jgi:hypothetical protein